VRWLVGGPVTTELTTDASLLLRNGHTADAVSDDRLHGVCVVIDPPAACSCHCPGHGVPQGSGGVPHGYEHLLARSTSAVPQGSGSAAAGTPGAGAGAAQAAGAGPAPAPIMRSARFHVTGMTCASCVANLENTLKK
jgi:hypothetical protein